MKIHVTQQDISNGHQRQTRHCPIALAVTRAAGNGHASVNTVQIVIYTDGIPIKVWDVPEHVAGKIRRYDRHGIMDPFEFEL